MSKIYVIIRSSRPHPRSQGCWDNTTWGKRTWNSCYRSQTCHPNRGRPARRIDLAHAWCARVASRRPRRSRETSCAGRKHGAAQYPRAQCPDGYQRDQTWRGDGTARLPGRRQLCEGEFAGPRGYQESPAAAGSRPGPSGQPMPAHRSRSRARVAGPLSALCADSCILRGWGLRNGHWGASRLPA